MSVYISSRTSKQKVIHKAGCFMSHRIEEDNKIYFDSIMEGQKEGYHLCKHCISMIKKSVSPSYIKKINEKNETLPKHYVVVDLEMSEVASENRIVCGNCFMEIIQIGAVLLDSDYQEIGHFNTLVKPQYNEVIGRKYEKLTGITTEMVKEAPVFSKALKMFLNWCKSIANHIEIFQWSPNDLDQIQKEMALKRYYPTHEENKYLKDWSDFQKEYSQKIRKKGCISLEKAIFYAGIEMEGNFHNALDDARNTGKLIHLLRDESLSKKFETSVVDVLEPKEFGTSLGALLQNISIS